jgi:hypothetical protein
MTNYSIVDIEGCAKAVRESVAKSFSEDYAENLDDFISVQQIVTLFEEHSLGQDDDGYEIINEEIFNFIFDEVRVWMYEVGLARLAAQGFVECAWDDEKEEMTFWLADKNQTTINNKPTK